MKLQLLFVISLAISGCGGSGGASDSNSNPSSSSGSSSISASSSSNPPREYSLNKLFSLDEGVVYESRLNRLNDNGIITHGSIWISNSPQEVVNGVLVTPRLLSFKEFTGSGNGSNSLTPRTSWLLTEYIDTATGNIIAFKQKDFYISSALECNAASPYRMPSIVKAGDQGDTTGFTCGELTLEPNSWQAAEKDDQLVLTFKFKGYGKRLVGLEFETAILDQEVFFILDQDGNIVSVKVDGLSSSKD